MLHKISSSNGRTPRMQVYILFSSVQCDDESCEMFLMVVALFWHIAFCCFEDFWSRCDSRTIVFMDNQANFKPF